MVLGENSSVLLNGKLSHPKAATFGATSPSQCGLHSILVLQPLSSCLPQPCCSASIYLSLPAFCLPSFPQLIYGHCLSAPVHHSLNLAIMHGSLWRPSICGASVRPDGLPSSSSIFLAVPVHPFRSGAAALVPLVASVLPPWTTASSSQRPFVLGCSQASGGSARSRCLSRAWGGFKEVIRVHCTERSHNPNKLQISTMESCLASLIFKQIVYINLAGKLFLFYGLGAGRGGLCRLMPSKGLQS